MHNMGKSFKIFLGTRNRNARRWIVILILDLYTNECPIVWIVFKSFGIRMNISCDRQWVNTFSLPGKWICLIERYLEFLFFIQFWYWCFSVNWLCAWHRKYICRWIFSISYGFKILMFAHAVKGQFLYTRLNTCLMSISRFSLRDKVTLRLLKLYFYISDVVEWSRALDIRLSNCCCSVSMVWVQIPSREEHKFVSSKI